MNILEELNGETITEVSGLQAGSEEIILTFANGKCVRFWHSQDCCEEVTVNDVDGSD